MSIVPIRKLGTAKVETGNRLYLIKDGAYKIEDNYLMVSSASYSTGGASGSPTFLPSFYYQIISMEYVGGGWIRGSAYFPKKIHLRAGSELCMTFRKNIEHSKINQGLYATRWGFGYCSSISTSTGVVPISDFNYAFAKTDEFITCRLPIFDTGDFYIYPYMINMTSTATDGATIEIKDMWIESTPYITKMLYHNGIEDVAWDMSNTYIAQDTGYFNSGLITETDTLSMQANSVKSAVVAITTDDKIDFSQYSALCIEAKFEDGFNVYTVDVSSLTSGYVVLSVWNTQVTNSATRSGVFISNTKQYYNFADYNNPLARLNFFTSDQPLGTPLEIKRVWLE